jgi:hypothetical protein
MSDLTMERIGSALSTCRPFTTARGIGSFREGGHWNLELLTQNAHIQMTGVVLSHLTTSRFRFGMGI